MQVCIRGEDLNLALELYTSMLKANLKPSLVTYNTLLDVWGGLGNSTAVLHTLQLIRASGLDPELRSYNVAIRACGRCGTCDDSLQVRSDRLSASALSPSGSQRLRVR